MASISLNGISKVYSEKKEEEEVDAVRELKLPGAHYRGAARAE